ncbi:phage tail protein [Paenibacillus sp. NRS-1760]|uniref:phage tail protein n=1 Tax=Paenibacillus sp. NRS-1760 TaxID=3233902 RepID=UPI003D28035F
MIGALGPVVFVASHQTIRTFSDFKRNSTSRWAKHEVIGMKPLTQRIGPGLDTIAFAMIFDAKYGLNPRKELDALTALERSGKPLALTIGGKGVGTGLWIITGLDQQWNIVDAAGNIVKGTAAITLEEYVK